MLPAITATSLKQNNGPTRISSSNSIDLQFQKLFLGLPLPKQETLSRHSFLGPNGLRAQWLGPSAEMKVNYPTNTVVDLSEITRSHPLPDPHAQMSTKAMEDFLKVAQENTAKNLETCGVLASSLVRL